MVDACYQTGPFQVDIVDTGESYPCRSHETLLQAMCRLGRAGIPVGCRGGGCGICKVMVVDGQTQAGRMSRAHVTRVEEAQGVVLACRAIPRTDLRIRILGKMHKSVCRFGRHEACGECGGSPINIRR